MSEITPITPNFAVAGTLGAEDFAEIMSRLASSAPVRTRRLVREGYMNITRL